MMRFIAFALFLIGSAPLASASPETEAYVANAAIELNDKTGADYARALAAHVDVPRVSRFILGRHARRFSAEERAQFTGRLEQFLIDSLVDQVRLFEGAQIEVLNSVDRNERDSVVTTRVTAPGEDAVIMRWRLVNIQDEWRVVDLEVFGLWVAIEQRAQVAAILERRDATLADVYDGLAPITVSE